MEFSRCPMRPWIQTTATVTLHRHKYSLKSALSFITGLAILLSSSWNWDSVCYSVPWPSQGMNNYLGQEKQNAMETEVEHNAFTQGKSHWLSLRRKHHQLLNNNRQSGLHLLPHRKNRPSSTVSLLIPCSSRQTERLVKSAWGEALICFW